MPVVTTRAASQNGGLATVVVGRAAPTVSGLAINAQQLPLGVLFPLDLWPPSFSSPASRANARTVHARELVLFLAGVRFLLLSSSLARLCEPLLVVLILPVAFPPLPVGLGRACRHCAVADVRTCRPPRSTSSPPCPGYK